MITGKHHPKKNHNWERSQDGAMELPGKDTSRSRQPQSCPSLVRPSVSGPDGRSSDSGTQPTLSTFTWVSVSATISQMAFLPGWALASASGIRSSNPSFTLTQPGSGFPTATSPVSTGRLELDNLDSWLCASYLWIIQRLNENVYSQNYLTVTNQSTYLMNLDY